MKIVSDVGNIEIGEAYIRLDKNGNCFLEAIFNEKGNIKTIAKFIPESSQYRNRLDLVQLDTKVTECCDAVMNLYSLHNKSIDLTRQTAKPESNPECDFLLDNHNTLPTIK